MWETTEDKVEFDAQVEERGEATLLQSKICYAFDIEQDLVIEIPLNDGSVARATLTPDNAAVLLRQICKVMEVEAPALPWYDAPTAPFTESDIPW
jgi:hypothetical protein